MSDYPIAATVVAAIGLFASIMMARNPDTTSTEVQVAQAVPTGVPTIVWPAPVQRNFPAMAQGQQPPVSGGAAAVVMPSPALVMPRGYIPPSTNKPIPVQTAVPPNK